MDSKTVKLDRLTLGEW